MENWKMHNKWPRFEVSDLGNIRNTSTKTSKYKRVCKSGYYVVQARVDGKIHTLKVHKLVADMWLEPPTEELILECSKSHHGKVCVNHKDGDKLNNIPSNLELCTHEYNVKHAYSQDLIPILKGELNGMSILTESDVHNICKLFEDGYSVAYVMSIYAFMSKSQIGKIRAGLAWAHIHCQYNIKVNKRSMKFND